MAPMVQMLFLLVAPLLLLLGFASSAAVPLHDDEVHRAAASLWCIKCSGQSCAVPISECRFFCNDPRDLFCEVSLPNISLRLPCRLNDEGIHIRLKEKKEEKTGENTEKIQPPRPMWEDVCLLS